MERSNRDPVFVPSFQNEQDAVALADSDGAKIITHLVADPADLLKRKNALLCAVVAPDKRFFFGLFLSPAVYDIKAKIEIRRHVHPIVCFKILIRIEVDPRKIFL